MSTATPTRRGPETSVMPALSGGFLAGRPAIGFWMLLFGGLGCALLRPNLDEAA